MSDQESELSTAPTIQTNPFSIAARSTASSAPAKHTRNIASRRPILEAKQLSQKHSTTSQQRLSIDYTALATIPTAIEDELKAKEDDDLSEDSATAISSSRLPQSGLKSSVSYSSTSSIRKSRAKTSGVHKHCTQQSYHDGSYFVCNYCSKSYKCTGGTGTMTRHLKERHQIDPFLSTVALRRKTEGSTIEAAILRGAEINIAAEEKRQKDLLAVHLDKTTLEYLYIQWTVTENIPFNQVVHTAFRSFLEYINPVANRLLPNAGSTIKIHAEALFREGKQRIRHILATAMSDIHITCDMWSSPNHLGFLAVVAHFTNEKSDLIALTLTLIEVQDDHSGSNQA